MWAGTATPFASSVTEMVFFFFSFLFVFFLSPRVWSLGASAKKQGEDLADNDGDEDEGISVLEAATA